MEEKNMIREEAALGAAAEEPEGNLYGICLGLSILPGEFLESNFVLPDTCRILLRKYLEKVYGKGKVFMPGCIFTPLGITDQAEIFLEEAGRFFEDGSLPERPDWEVQHQVLAEDAEQFREFAGEKYVRIPACFWIPFALAPDVTPDPQTVFLRSYFDRAGIGAPDLQESRFADKLKEHFGSASPTVSPGPVHVSRILAYSLEFNEIAAGKKQGS